MQHDYQQVPKGSRTKRKDSSIIMSSHKVSTDGYNEQQVTCSKLADHSEGNRTRQAKFELLDKQNTIYVARARADELYHQNTDESMPLQGSPRDATKETFVAIKTTKSNCKEEANDASILKMLSGGNQSHPLGRNGNKDQILVLNAQQQQRSNANSKTKAEGQSIVTSGLTQQTEQRRRSNKKTVYQSYQCNTKDSSSYNRELSDLQREFCKEIRQTSRAKRRNLDLLKVLDNASRNATKHHAGAGHSQEQDRTIYTGARRMRLVLPEEQRLKSQQMSEPGAQVSNSQSNNLIRSGGDIPNLQSVDSGVTAKAQEHTQRQRTQAVQYLPLGQ